MKLALNPDEFKQNTHTRGIGDDVDNEVEDDWTVETLLSLPHLTEKEPCGVTGARSILWALPTFDSCIGGYGKRVEKEKSDESFLRKLSAVKNVNKRCDVQVISDVIATTRRLALMAFLREGE